MMDIGLFEVIETCPAMRRLKELPVEEEKVRKLLDAANFAPSSGNSQPWEFIVVKAPNIKQEISTLAASGFQILSEIGAMYPDSPEMWPAVQRSKKLIDNYAKIPLLVLICLDRRRIMSKVRLRRGALLRHLSNAAGLRKLQHLSNCASIFPALQNLILAARGLGLGASITMTALIFERKIKRLLGIPSHITPMAIVALGYPKGKFIKPRRRAYTDVVRYDHW